MQERLALYKAYSTARQTVSKTRQVVMLYDGIINYLRQAQQAITENRYEDRYNLLSKASDVVFAMRSSLDFDQGGKVAQILDGFYSSLDLRMMALNRSNNANDCAQILNDVKEMRDAWDAIDRQDTEQAAPVAAASSASAGEKKVEKKPDQQQEQQQPASPLQGIQISA